MLKTDRHLHLVFTTDRPQKMTATRKNEILVTF